MRLDSSEWLVVFGFFLVVNIVGSYLVAKAAQKKNRSFGAFLAIGLFLGWIISGIIVAIMPKEKEASS
jgi:uncharacterized membrane protein YciS (DUF1049 family)